MKTTRKMLVSFGVGLVALTLVLALVVTVLVQSSAPAAQAQAVANTPTAVATIAKETGIASTSKTDQTQLLDSFVKDLATHLNVSENQLNAALAATIADTVDNMVKSGQLNQGQADMIKKFTANGVTDLLPLLQGQMSQLLGKGETKNTSSAKEAMGGMLAQSQQLIQPLIQAAATSLNLTPDQLQSQLKAGKSLSDIAKAQNVDIQKVKDALLTSGKTQLDAVVKSGKLTQSQADKVYQTAQLWIDDIVTMQSGSH